MHQPSIANEWYRSNGMLVNPTKHQAMIIAKETQIMCFPFRCKNQMELFGITCKKITNQFKVISRFRKLIPATVLLRLYKAYNTTLPVLFYRMAFL